MNQDNAVAEALEVSVLAEAAYKEALVIWSDNENDCTPPWELQTQETHEWWCEMAVFFRRAFEALKAQRVDEGGVS